MGLMDTTEEEPKSKVRRWVVTTLLFIIVASLAGWYFFRYQTEKNTVTHFMSTLQAGNTQEAYRLWKPVSGYSYQDFLSDWGPSGEFGPVKGFKISATDRPKRASGVIVVVDVDNGGGKTQEVRIWVQRNDQSLSFPP